MQLLGDACVLRGATPTPNNGQRQLVNGHPTRAGSEYIAVQMLKAIANLR